MKAHQATSATAEARPPAEVRDVFETMTTLYTKGLERLAEIQKKGIDVAAQQTAELSDIWKTVSKTGPTASSFFLFDLAYNSFEQLAITQKGAIDLIVEQNRAITGLMKERGTTAGKATEGLASLLRQTVDRSIEAQKKVLDYSAAQTKAAVNTFKHQYGVAGTPVEKATDSFQHGLDVLIETQKELLDLATRPFKAA